MNFEYADKLTRAADAMISAALEQTVPPAWRAMVQTAYRAGYEFGREEAETEANIAAAVDFDAGWDKGYEAGRDEADSAYVQGVADARARPAVADEKVAFLCDKDAFNGEEQLDMFDDEDWFADEAYVPIDGCTCDFCVESRAMDDND